MTAKSNQIKIGAIISYIGVFFGIITGLLYHPWMIKTIGNSDYGLYSLSMSLINTFLIDFGLSMASQRFISKYLAEKDQKAIDNVVGLIFKLYLILTAVLIIIFAVLFCFLDKIYLQLTPSEISKFKVLFIMVAIYSITTFPFVTLNGVLSSYEKFIPLKLCDLFYKILTITLTAIALFFVPNVYVLVVINIIASVIITVIRIIVIKTTTPLKVNFKYSDKNVIKELFSFSIWTSISAVAMRLLLSLGPSIIGIVSGSGSLEIAIFGYAVSVEGHVYTFVNAINGFFMPKLSRISINENKEQTSNQVVDLMVVVGRFILILYGLIFVGFLVLGKTFIILLVGKTYVNAYYCVLLICGYGIIAYPQQIANTYTIVKNKVKKRALISILSILIYLLFAFVFGSFLGSVGISIAIFISLILQTILMNVLYYKDLDLNVWKFFKNCHLKLLPGLLSFTLLAFLINLIPIFGWLGFALKVLIVSLAYLIIVWLIMLNKKEKQSLLGKFLKKKGIKNANNS